MSDAKRTPKRNGRYCDPQCPYLVRAQWSFDVCRRYGGRPLPGHLCLSECMAEAERPPVLVTEVVSHRTDCSDCHQVQVSLHNGWHTRCEIPFGATTELAAQRLRQLADRVEALGRGQDGG